MKTANAIAHVMLEEKNVTNVMLNIILSPNVNVSNIGIILQCRRGHIDFLCPSDEGNIKPRVTILILWPECEA